MTRSTPTLSVLMPVYNCRPYVGQALRSILAQTVQDFEVVVVDDGSTDGSGDVVARLARRDERIQLIRQPNAGVVAARNATLEHARADLVVLADADDLSPPHRIERLLAYMAEHPECVAVGSAARTIDPDGYPIEDLQVPTEHEAIDRAVLECRGRAMVFPSAMFRRQVMLDVGKYRKEYEWSEDRDLYLRVAERGRVANLPEVLYLYRMRPTSTSHARKDQQLQNRRRLIEETCRRRGIAMPEIHVAEWSPRSVEETRRAWAWRALDAGYRQTARRIARQLLVSSPANPDNVKLWTAAFCDRWWFDAAHRLYKLVGRS